MRSNGCSVYCLATGQKLITVAINMYETPDISREIREWFDKQGWQIDDRWFHGSTTFSYRLRSVEYHFRNENDAMLFKLAWA